MPTARLAPLLAKLVLLVAAHSALGQQPAQDAAEAAALLSLPAACSNWDSATAELPGAAWQAGTDPCGAADASGEAWRGVSCSVAGRVTELALGGLGLAGTLPGQLAALGSLALLDLGGNAFQGSLPPGWLEDGGFPSLVSADLGGNKLQGTLPPDWSSTTLAALDLSDNQLTAGLPPSWGGGPLPALSQLALFGNSLQGMIPMPEWTSVSAFANPSATVVLRQKNAGICGPVMPLDPQLFPAGNVDRNATLIPAANLMHTGEEMTTLILTQRDLFSPNTSVTITNWLGSCMTPCDQLSGGLAQAPAGVAAAGLPWPPSITTNLFDLGWQYNMTMADLAELNPGGAWMQPGDELRLPCYPAQGAIAFAYYGGDVAFGQFSGGNQLAGPEGLPAAMAAARVNAGIPNTFHWPSIYTGSTAPEALGGGIVQPVYWFADMLAPYHVASVLVTAGAISTNVSIYVGNNSTSVLANTRVASGINLAAGQQLAYPGWGVLGRYIILYTGMLEEGSISLDDVQVYTYESNAAHNKPVAASGQSPANQTGGGAPPLQALVDNNVSTCIWLAGGADDSPAYATVDLGYVGNVGSVVAVAGAEVALGTLARAYVTQAPDEPLADSAACSSEERELWAGAWMVGACNRRGRYVTLQVLGTAGEARVQLCELQAALTLHPEPPSSDDDTDGGGGLSSGAIAGIVVGGLLAAALLALAATYLLWRRRWLAHQRKMAALKAGKGFDQEEWDRQHAPDLESGSSNQTKRPSWDGGSGTAAAAAGVKVGGFGGGSGELEEGDVEAGAEGKGGKDAAAAGDGKNGSGNQQAEKAGEHSELALLKEFFRGLLGRRTLEDFSGTLRHRSQTTSAFTMVKAGTVSNADTDLTKLPQGFSEVSPSDIQLVEIVGEGSFGEVWLARYCGALVAVKILGPVGSDNMTSSIQHHLLMRSLKKEAALMSKLRHPNVCLYLGACTDPPSLVFEYCAKSSLDMLLRAGLRHPQMAKRLTWVRLLSLALDAAKGMLYLHSRSPPIAHRDLKSANLLVDSQWHVKVADFSLSRTLELGATSFTVVQTNPRWLAPEVLDGMPGQLPADVWAFGTVLWELLTWRLPFEGLNTYQIISVVQRTGGSGLAVPASGDLAAGAFTCYPQYVRLMQACWCHEPAGRPQFGAIVEQLGLMLAAELAPQQAAAAAAASEMPAMHRPPGSPPVSQQMGRSVRSRQQQQPQSPWQQQQQQKQQQQEQQDGGRASARGGPTASGSTVGSSGSGSGGGAGAALAAALPPGIPEDGPSAAAQAARMSAATPAPSAASGSGDSRPSATTS